MGISFLTVLEAGKANTEVLACPIAGEVCFLLPRWYLMLYPAEEGTPVFSCLKITRI
jgi:hypothetical protein